MKKQILGILVIFALLSFTKCRQQDALVNYDDINLIENGSRIISQQSPFLKKSDEMIKFHNNFIVYHQNLEKVGIEESERSFVIAAKDYLTYRKIDFSNEKTNFGVIRLALFAEHTELKQLNSNLNK